MTKAPNQDNLNCAYFGDSGKMSESSIAHGNKLS